MRVIYSAVLVVVIFCTSCYAAYRAAVEATAQGIKIMRDIWA